MTDNPCRCGAPLPQGAVLCNRCADNLREQLHKIAEPCAWPCMSKSVVRLASLLDEHAAEALEDAADKFQWGAWIDVLSGGLVQRRTDGEAVVRWLRERSRALRGEA